MEAQGQESEAASQGNERSEPVRSRWTPKPEQILILESIFNSGMVNPTKDETVGIRKMLEKYGGVGDANVFYWFQNRRSRSRRRQRQMQQASLAATTEQTNQATQHGAIPYQCNSSQVMGYRPTAGAFVSTPTAYLAGSSSNFCGFGTSVADHNLFPFSNHVGLPEMDRNSAVASSFCPSNNQNLQYHTVSGFITVLINGVPTEIPKGQFDMKSLVGQDVMLVHSSGVPVLVNEFGFLLDNLQHGESYFLVPKPA